MEIKSKVKNKKEYQLVKVTDRPIQVGDVIERKGVHHKLVEMNPDSFVYRKLGKASGGFAESKAKNSLLTLKEKEHRKASRTFYEIVEVETNKKTIVLERVESKPIAENTATKKLDVFGSVADEVAEDKDVSGINEFSKEFSIYDDTVDFIELYKQYMGQAVNSKDLVLAHIARLTNKINNASKLKDLMQGYNNDNCLVYLFAVELATNTPYKEDASEKLVTIFNKIVKGDKVTGNNEDLLNALKSSSIGVASVEELYGLVAEGIKQNYILALTGAFLGYAKEEDLIRPNRYFSYVIISNLSPKDIETHKAFMALENIVDDGYLGRYGQNADSFKLQHDCICTTNNIAAVNYIISGIKVLAKNYLAANKNNYTQLQCEPVYKLIQTLNNTIQQLA